MLLGVLFLTLEKVKPRVHFYRLLDLGYRATAQDHVDKLEAAFKADDILEDMKELGKHDRFFWMPICKSKKRFVNNGEDNRGFEE